MILSNRILSLRSRRNKCEHSYDIRASLNWRSPERLRRCPAERCRSGTLVPAGGRAGVHQWAVQLTPDALNEAQRLSREWDAAHPREP